MQYDFSLTAGGAQSFDVVGKFIKYQYGTGLIRVRMSMGEYVDLMPGQGVFSVDYTRFTVTDRSGAGNNGALLAGDFVFRDSTITGSVEVKDIIGAACQYKSVGGATVVGSDVAVPFVTPAQNTNGIIVREFKIYTSSSTVGSVSTASLFASIDSVNLYYGFNRLNTIFLGGIQAEGIDAKNSDVSQISRRIPAGWGLYAVSKAFNTAGAYRVDVSFEM